MPCNHKRVWTVMRYVVSEDNWQGAVNAFGAKVLQPRYDTYIHKLLENGWDPYPWGEGGIMFKRLKPCEECPKAKITAGRFPSEIFDEYKKKHGI